jgi:hypothetical protein
MKETFANLRLRHRPGGTLDKFLDQPDGGTTAADSRIVTDLLWVEEHSSERRPLLSNCR